MSTFGSTVPSTSANFSRNDGRDALISSMKKTEINVKGTDTMMEREREKEKKESKSPPEQVRKLQQSRVRFAPEFDGLNFFETLVSN